MDNRFILIEKSLEELKNRYDIENIRNDIHQITDYLKKYNFSPNSFLEIGSRDGNDTKIISDFWDINNNYIIEAHPDCYDYIKYKYPYFNVSNFAASDTNGTINFYAGDINSEMNIGASSVLKINRYFSSNEINIKSCKIKDFMIEQSINSFDLIKIDVEGFGLNVLKGLEEKIKNTFAIQIETEEKELWYNQLLHSDIEEYMKNMGFVLISKIPSWDNQYDCLFINNNLIKYKLSFCITCMNRLDFLKQTLLNNLNLIYSLRDEYNIEIVLINYDSKDEMDDYIQNNFKKFINEQLLIYKKVENKEFFYRTHAKNISHLNATGDILCNLDVDCLLSKELIIETYNSFIDNGIDNIIVHHYHGLNWGYICLSKHNFKLLQGYDENMYYYGCEDNDILIRFILKIKGKIKRISNYNHLNIDHSDDFRIGKSKDINYNKGMSNYANSIICNYNLENNITTPNNGVYGEENLLVEIKELINYSKYISKYELLENIINFTNDNWLSNDLSNKFYNIINQHSF